MALHIKVTRNICLEELYQLSIIVLPMCYLFECDRQNELGLSDYSLNGLNCLQILYIFGIVHTKMYFIFSIECVCVCFVSMNN